MGQEKLLETSLWVWQRPCWKWRSSRLASLSSFQPNHTTAPTWTRLHLPTPPRANPDSASFETKPNQTKTGLSWLYLFDYLLLFFSFSFSFFFSFSSTSARKIQFGLFWFVRFGLVCVWNLLLTTEAQITDLTLTRTRLNQKKVPICTSLDPTKQSRSE